ncbi:MAG: tyrosine-type recombinase/integrase [Bacilli bacterium]
MNKFNLVFVNEKIHWPISNSYVNGVIKEICEKSKIARGSSHSFRHARTDYFILSGADSIYIKDQLDYENISTTLKHYAQMNKYLRVKNKDILKEYFEGAI